MSEGYLYIDDGTSHDSSAYDLIHFQFTNSNFVMKVIHNKWANGHKPDQTISTVVDRIRIYGIELSVSPKDNSNVLVVYDEANQILDVSNLNFDWSSGNRFEYIFANHS